MEVSISSVFVYDVLLLTTLVSSTLDASLGTEMSRNSYVTTDVRHVARIPRSKIWILCTPWPCTVQEPRGAHNSPITDFTVTRTRPFSRMCRMCTCVLSFVGVPCPSCSRGPHPRRSLRSYSELSSEELELGLDSASSAALRLVDDLANGGLRVF